MRRRIKIAVLILLVLLVATIAAAPYLAAFAPLRDLLIRAVLPRVHGSIASQDASLGWFAPIRFDGIEIRDDGGQPVIRIPHLEGSQPLWQYIVHPTQLGRFKLNAPQFNLVMTDHGLNLRDLFVPPKAIPKVSFDVDVVDATVNFRGRYSSAPWPIEHLSLSISILGDDREGQGPEFVIHPGKVCDHEPITRQMCEDMLKFAAPVVAGSSSASGELSLELDEWRLPLTTPKQGRGAGRLTIHWIDFQPGPVAQKVATLLKLPTSSRIANDCVVPFHLTDERIYHENLVFGVKQLTVCTAGYVGLDQSLDMLAEVSIPTGILPGAPFEQELKGKHIDVPIHGTLAQPKIELGAGDGSTLALFTGALEDWLKTRAGDGQGILERLTDPNREKPILDWWRDRRQNKKESTPAPPSASSRPIY